MNMQSLPGSGLSNTYAMGPMTNPYTVEPLLVINEVVAIAAINGRKINGFAWSYN